MAVEWVVADVVDSPRPATYDLVSAQYPAFRKDADGRAVQAIVDAVAPAGPSWSSTTTSRRCSPSTTTTTGTRPSTSCPPTWPRVLGDGWTIEVDEVRTRVRPAGSPGPDVPDVVLRARRT